MSSPFDPYIHLHYAKTRQHYPAEGRRRWRLRVAQQFWTAVGPDGSDLPIHQLEEYVSPEVRSIEESDTDPDPLDGVTRDAPGLGLIVRTDFSDEPSWEAFCARLQDSERELVLAESEDAEENVSRQPLQPVDQDSDSDSEDEDVPPVIFHIVNPSTPQERAFLANASNLTVLRLFNDVDIRLSPTLPHGAKRINPPNRLVDSRGWQEFYRGKNVWIYDTKSNIDQCVRVVSQSGDIYGTATGDSWRARVSHICEIQVNLSSGAIRIDFGGLDRWDFGERSRNMVEAESRGHTVEKSICNVSIPAHRLD